MFYKKYYELKRINNFNIDLIIDPSEDDDFHENDYSIIPTEELTFSGIEFESENGDYMDKTYNIPPKLS